MKIDRDALEGTIGRMKGEGYTYLVKITAVDYSDHIDALYMIRNMEASKDEILEVSLNPSDLWVPTIISVHRSADWYERELYEMFGISIKGRSTPRLLLEKWDGTEYPLRKSFAWDSQYKTSEPGEKPAGGE